MWIEAEVIDDDADHYSFLFGVGLAPQVSLGAYTPFEDGALAEYHPYGAMIWPRHLSEHHGAAQAVHATWLAPGAAATPEDALATSLAAAGIDYTEAFGELCAQDAAWDYRLGAAYRENVEAYATLYSGDAAPEAGVVRGRTVGLEVVDPALAPGPWGCGVAGWQSPGEGTWDVRVLGAPLGSAGTGGTWTATAVLESPAGVRYVPLVAGALPASGEAGDQGAALEGAPPNLVTLEGSETGLWLVAALASGGGYAHRGQPGADERWSWGWSVAEAPPADSGDDGGDDSDAPWGTKHPEEPRACGCGVGGPASAWIAALVAGVTTTSRRRRRPLPCDAKVSPWSQPACRMDDPGRPPPSCSRSR
jgi:hypothetical protein